MEACHEQPRVRRIVFLRGLPGCGKSTKAKQIAADAGFAHYCIFEADQYFYDTDGIYRFNPALLRDAHDFCKQRAWSAMAEGAPLVVISNTSTQAWELYPYIEAAAYYGYQIEVHDLYDGGCSLEVLAGRNVHSVPLEAYERMVARYEKHPQVFIPTGVWSHTTASEFLQRHAQRAPGF